MCVCVRESVSPYLCINLSEVYCGLSAFGWHGDHDAAVWLCRHHCFRRINHRLGRRSIGEQHVRVLHFPLRTETKRQVLCCSRSCLPAESCPSQSLYLPRNGTVSADGAGGEPVLICKASNAFTETAQASQSMGRSHILQWCLGRQHFPVPRPWCICERSTCGDCPRISRTLPVQAFGPRWVELS